LQRLTGQSDLSVGTPVANRERVEIEALIGFFVNTLVMRTDLTGDPTLAELLGRVREVTLGAFAHQELPFEVLVEDLQPVRDLSHSPLFQAMFALQNAPLRSLELPDLTLSSVAVERQVAQFDLALGMVEDEGQLHGALDYKSELFDRTTIERLAWHFVKLLEE